MTQFGFGRPLDAGNKVDMRYRLNDDFRQAEYVSTGVRPDANQHVLIELDTPELRAKFGNSRMIDLRNYECKVGAVGYGFHVYDKMREYDHYLTSAEAVTEYDAMKEQKTAAQAEYEIKNQQWQAENAAKNKTLQEQKEAKRLEDEQRRARELGLLSTIEWDESSELPTAIVNLYTAIAARAGAESAEWVKEVTGFNPGHMDGYMYAGDFLKDRRIEIKRPARARVFIVKVYQSKRVSHYHVVTLNADGKLELHESFEDDKNEWAIILKAKVAALLPQAPVKRVVVNFDDDQYQMLGELARYAGLTMEQFIKQALHSQYPEIKV